MDKRLICTMKNQDKRIDSQLKLVGEKIKKIRKLKYPSYEKFAFAHDLNRVTYGRIENGNDVRLSNLFKVLNALEISPEEFFKDIKPNLLK